MKTAPNAGFPARYSRSENSEIRLHALAIKGNGTG